MQFIAHTARTWRVGVHNSRTEMGAVSCHEPRCPPHGKSGRTPGVCVVSGGQRELCVYDVVSVCEWSNRSTRCDLASKRVIFALESFRLLRKFFFLSLAPRGGCSFIDPRRAQLRKDHREETQARSFAPPPPVCESVKYFLSLPCSWAVEWARMIPVAHQLDKAAQDCCGHYLNHSHEVRQVHT